MAIYGRIDKSCRKLIRQNTLEPSSKLEDKKESDALRELN